MSNFFVEISYENGSTVVIESVGPHSVIGFVSDAVFGHFIEGPNNIAVRDIRIGRRLTAAPRISVTDPVPDDLSWPQGKTHP